MTLPEEIHVTVRREWMAESAKIKGIDKVTEKIGQGKEWLFQKMDFLPEWDTGESQKKVNNFLLEISILSRQQIRDIFHYKIFFRTQNRYDVNIIFVKLISHVFWITFTGKTESLTWWTADNQINRPILLLPRE